jgi:hypothetical protein
MEDRSLIRVNVMRVGKLNSGILLRISSGHVFHINRLSVSNAVICNGQTSSCWVVLAVMITGPLITRLKNKKHSFISDFKGGGCLHFMKCVCVCVCVCMCVCVYVWMYVCTHWFICLYSRLFKRYKHKCCTWCPRYLWPNKVQISMCQILKAYRVTDRFKVENINSWKHGFK